MRTENARFAPQEQATIGNPGHDLTGHPQIPRTCLNVRRAAATAKSVVAGVDDFFDCLHQAGVRPVAALTGSALYAPRQRTLLQRFPRVILMPDGDAAGRHATAAIAARLHARCSVQPVHVPKRMET